MAGASSTARGSVVEPKVEMNVRMVLEQGKHAVITYKVNSSARMQSVINKVLIVLIICWSNLFLCQFLK